MRRTIGIMDVLSHILAIDCYWTAIAVTAFLIGLRTITSTELMLELWSRPCLLALKASLLGPLSPRKNPSLLAIGLWGSGFRVSDLGQEQAVELFYIFMVLRRMFAVLGLATCVDARNSRL